MNVKKKGEGGSILESCFANISRVRERQSGKEEERGGEVSEREKDGALGKDQSLVPGELRQMK